MICFWFYYNSSYDAPEILHTFLDNWYNSSQPTSTVVFKIWLFYKSSVKMLHNILHNYVYSILSRMKKNTGRLHIFANLCVCHLVRISDWRLKILIFNIFCTIVQIKSKSFEGEEKTTTGWVLQYFFFHNYIGLHSLFFTTT